MVKDYGRGDLPAQTKRCILVCLLSLGGLNAQGAPAARTAKVLVLAPSGFISNNTIKSVCADPPTTICNPSTTRAWMRRGASRHEHLFLIDDSMPKLIELDMSDPAHPSVFHSWDFFSYRHSRSASDEEQSEKLSIFPALYPVGVNEYAVAILKHSKEMYSGGGAWFETADFVILNDDSERAALYASVPFSCDKWIRACFSEEDYKKKDSCHDNYSGSLRIAFPESPDPNPSWRFTWLENDVSIKFSVPPYGVGKPLGPVTSVPFCEGGPAEFMQEFK